MSELKFKIGKSGRLLDQLESRLKGALSRRAIKRLLDAGRCRVNGRVERFASRVLPPGARVEFQLEDLAEVPKTFELSRVLFEDDYLLAYNKPAGISSDQGGLIQILKEQDPSIELVHRLDKETTGVILFSKGDPEGLFDLFRQRQMRKVYWAIADGVPRKGEGEVRNYLGVRASFEGQKLQGSVDKSKGRLAVSHWRLEASGGGASCLVFQPKTGRTHQIRVHASEMGHPLLGDSLYGRDTRCSYRAPRCLLHARSLCFTHPHTQACLTVEAPLPDDFKAALDYIYGS